MTEAPNLTLTKNAAKRVSALIEQNGAPNMMFRVQVSGGGCSGFQYSFSLAEYTEDDDLSYDQHGVTLVVDQASLDLIDGAEVDFVEDLIGSSFRVNNPQATATCGCGTSFSV